MIGGLPGLRPAGDDCRSSCPRSARSPSRSQLGSPTATSAPSLNQELLERFRAAAKAGATAQAGFKVAWAATEDDGVRLTHRIRPNSGLPGELSQVLPTPQHFEQASTLVTEEQTRAAVTAGQDPAAHVAAFAPYVEAGFDEVYVGNMGPHWAQMLRAYGSEVLPELHTRTAQGRSGGLAN